MSHEPLAICPWLPRSNLLLCTAFPSMRLSGILPYPVPEAACASRPLRSFCPRILVVAACSGERPASSDRDLTLAPSVESATASAVVSARELGRPEIEQSRAARQRHFPHQPGARPGAPRAGVSAPAAAPAADPEPDPEVDDAVDAGGHALAPGQSVSVIPATSGAGPAPAPYSDYAGEGEMRNHGRPGIVHGDDRCIPGRGEVIPRAARPAGHVRPLSQGLAYLRKNCMVVG